MSDERDLAEALHHEIISPESVEYALEVWRDSLLLKTWSEADRMKSVLGHVSRSALQEVLARRQRETARTGPWDGSMLAGTNPGDTPATTGQPLYPGSLVPPRGKP